MKTRTSSLASVVLLITGAIALLPSAVGAAEIESFTEPYRRVDVPAPEIGTLQELLVDQGDAVTQSQLLARMNDSILIASLEVARVAKDARGTLRSAESAVKAKQKQFESYRSLRERGNATQREADRAENELIQAQGQLQSVREELEVRRLEYERIRAQLQHRQIKSPINGFVVAIEKEAGEFVSPTDPIVLRVVQLDTLKVIFAVPLNAARDLKVRQQATLAVGVEKAKCRGVIDFISPTAEPQTGLVEVKIRIPNQNGKIQSGAVCVWDMTAVDAAEQISQHRMPAVR